MDNKPPAALSKSKYLAGLQCPKLLWYEYNQKSELPPIDAATQAVFDEGKRVGEMAQKLFPEGISIERSFIPEQQNLKSIEALKARKPLFEAGFLFQRAYAIADILVPVDGDEWDLIEVKSSTQVKDEHYYDVAFQKYVYEGAGLKIRKSYLMYINKEYVRRGEIEPRKLFAKVDISEQIEERKNKIAEEIDILLGEIEQPEAPGVKVGPHCTSPRDCPLYDLCWNFLPEEASVFILYRGGKQRFELMERGILKIADVPESEINDKQLIQVRSHRSGEAHIDKVELGRFLDQIKYPAYFLDFETLAPAIPVYDNTRPYLEIPFQYSLYKVEYEGAMPQHFSYLAPGDVDPRPEVLRKLKEELGEFGSIIAYSSSFEIKVIRNAAEYYKEYLHWFELLQTRFVDLLEPFKNFFYYSPQQNGSASLKSVLPAITGSSYKGLQIANGQMAAIEYVRVTFRPVEENDRLSVRAALEKYCDLDTRGMIEILAALKEAVK